MSETTKPDDEKCDVCGAVLQFPDESDPMFERVRATAEPQGFNLAGMHRCCNEWPECGHMLAWYERLKQRVPNERLTQILEAATLWCGDCETQSLADEMLTLRAENAALRALLAQRDKEVTRARQLLTEAQTELNMSTTPSRTAGKAASPEIANDDTQIGSPGDAHSFGC